MSEFVLALFGFGRLAREYYLPALHTLDVPIRLVIVDPAETSREAAKQAWPQAVLYDDGDTMFAHEKPDAAVIASPPSTHLALWKLASVHRVPVLMEKPFPLPEDIGIVEANAAYASPTMVNFNRRHWSEYQDLAGRIADAGRPAHLSITLQTNAAAWSTVTRHRFEKKEGGALADLGSHAIDLLVWFTGDWPETVSVNRSLPFTAAEKVDVQAVFTCGSTAELHIGYGKSNLERVEVETRRSKVCLANPNGRIWDMRTPRLVQAVGDFLLLAERAVCRNRSMLRSTIAKSLGLFVRSVRAGSPQCNLSHAIRCARFLQHARALSGNAT